MAVEYFNIALKNMKKRRLRAFLTLVGILISITTIFVLISLSLGLEAAIQEQFEELGTDKFFVQPRGQFGPPGGATAAQLTKDDMDVVEQISGVDDIDGYILSPSRIEYKDNIRFVNTIGLNPDKIELSFGSYEIDEGRYLEEGDTFDVMLGSQYKYNDYLGRPVSARDTVEINDVEFNVVGIVEPTGSPPDDRQVYMPIDTARDLFDIPDRVDFIVVQVSDPDELNDVADRVERRLMRTRDVDEDTVDFSILTPEELLGAFSTVLDIVTFFLAGIALISLLVGGINIANAMFTSVLERTREIGVMKAIGAPNGAILQIFVIEAGLLGLVGGALGVGFGMVIGKAVEFVAVNQLGTNLLKVVFPAWLILASLGFAFLAGAVSGLWPAWKATKIKPVEALRYE